jgi:hypothetical protein
MTSANAPYPYFNGITYNPSFFSSSTSTGITQTQANLLYLKKTTADIATALETFSGGIKSSSYDASDTATGITALAIGSSVIHGNIVIGNAQTDGDIIIGASDALGATITVGTTSTATTINGTLTANNGLTLASGQYITTSHSGTVSAPTSTQIGGIINGSSISTTPPTTTTVSSIGSIALTAGTWVLSATRQYNNSQNSSRINFSYGDTLRTSNAQVANDVKYGTVSVPFSNQINYANISAIVSLTASATVYLNVYMEYTAAPSIGNTNFVFNAVRIA